MYSLTSNCLIFVNENEKSQDSASIMSNLSDSSQVRMSTAEQFSLTEQAKTFIDQITKKQIANFNSLEQPSKKTSKNQDTIVISDSDEKAWHQSDIQDSWVEISHCGFYLFERDRMILQNDKQWLNDNHILCAQILIQEQFPQFSGLKSTILQKIAPLKPFQPQSKSLQILHVNGNHWIAVSTVGCTASTEDIVVYDSKYASLSAETKLFLSQLVHTDKPAFTVKVASVTKQSGSADCGLFATVAERDTAAAALAALGPPIGCGWTPRLSRARQKLKNRYSVYEWLTGQC